jgi:hypothetical protein
VNESLSAEGTSRFVLERFFGTGEAESMATLSEGGTEERFKADWTAHLFGWQQLCNRYLASPRNSGSRWIGIPLESLSEKCAKLSTSQRTLADGLIFCLFGLSYL